MNKNKDICKRIFHGKHCFLSNSLRPCRAAQGIRLTQRGIRTSLLLFCLYLTLFPWKRTESQKLKVKISLRIPLRSEKFFFFLEKVKSKIEKSAENLRILAA